MKRQNIDFDNSIRSQVSIISHKNSSRSLDSKIYKSSNSTSPIKNLTKNEDDSKRDFYQISEDESSVFGNVGKYNRAALQKMIKSKPFHSKSKGEDSKIANSAINRLKYLQKQRSE